MMAVSIEPQWKKICHWYWTQFQGDRTHTSIWDMLEQDHGAVRKWALDNPSWSTVYFSHEQDYIIFLLRWS